MKISFVRRWYWTSRLESPSAGSLWKHYGETFIFIKAINFVTI